MTRRDYERIAAALGTAQAADHRATTGPNSEHIAASTAVRRSQRRAIAHVAMALEAENPRFDRQRFERAITTTADVAHADPLAFYADQGIYKR